MFNLYFAEAQTWFYLGVGFLKYFCEVQPSCQPRGALSSRLSSRNVIQLSLDRFQSHHKYGARHCGSYGNDPGQWCASEPSIHYNFSV